MGKRCGGQVDRQRPELRQREGETPQQDREGGLAHGRVIIAAPDRGAAPTPDLTALSPGTTAANYSHCCFHNVFTGPAGYSGLDVLAISR